MSDNVKAERDSPEDPFYGMTEAEYNDMMEKTKPVGSPSAPAVDEDNKVDFALGISSPVLVMLATLDNTSKRETKLRKKRDHAAGMSDVRQVGTIRTYLNRVYADIDEARPISAFKGTIATSNAKWGLVIDGVKALYEKAVVNPKLIGSLRAACTSFSLITNPDIILEHIAHFEAHGKVKPADKKRKATNAKSTSNKRTKTG